MNMFSVSVNFLYQAPKRKLKRIVNNRLNAWLRKRIPSKNSHSLSNKNIFIIPTRFGFSFLIFVFLLFLLGTNYQNNTILLFCYLLASLFITVMMHSFFNLSKITLSSSKKQYVYANKTAFFPIIMETKKEHYDLNFYFVNNNKSDHNSKLHTTSLLHCKQGKNTVSIPYNASKRGLYNIGRVKVYSEYSLGLFISWSMLDFAHQLIVFPQPKKLHNIQQYLTSIDSSADQQIQYNSTTTGIDDFLELKTHIVGESQARIAWKQLARGQGKLSKHYQSQQGSLLWLKLSDMPSTDLEIKLSYLCYLIMEYGKSDCEYGVILNTTQYNKGEAVQIPPNTGFKHQRKCLVALARFQLSKEGER